MWDNSSLQLFLNHHGSSSVLAFLELSMLATQIKGHAPCRCCYFLLCLGVYCATSWLPVQYLLSSLAPSTLYFVHAALGLGNGKWQDVNIDQFADRKTARGDRELFITKNTQ